MLPLATSHSEIASRPVRVRSKVQPQGQPMNISSIGTSDYSQYSTSSTSKADMANELLKQMDTDQDGKVSKDEFIAFGRMMEAEGAKGPPPPPPLEQSEGTMATRTGASPSPDTMFSNVDTNGDGSLSVDELSSMLTAAETQASVMQAPPLDALFSSADVNGNGSLSVDEISASLSKSSAGLSSA
jgi:Ca2+-binding EF-hand superfamily protein